MVDRHSHAPPLERGSGVCLKQRGVLSSTITITTHCSRATQGEGKGGNKGRGERWGSNSKARGGIAEECVWLGRRTARACVPWCVCVLLNVLEPHKAAKTGGSSSGTRESLCVGPRHGDWTEGGRWAKAEAAKQVNSVPAMNTSTPLSPCLPPCIHNHPVHPPPATCHRPTPATPPTCTPELPLRC